MSDVLGNHRVVPVVVLNDPADAAPLGVALLAGGLAVAEVTFRTAAAEQALKELAANPALHVGAGTVIRVEQVERAVAAGARFIVSPGVSIPVIRRCQELGVPVRRVEAAAWFGSGLAFGAADLLLPDLLTSLDYTALTFLVIASLAAALIGRLQSLWATLFGGLAVGLAQSVVTPYTSLSAYRSAAPFVLAIAALLFLSRRRVVTVSRAGA